LNDQGFIVIPGPIPSEQLEYVADEYDRAFVSASANDISIGSTTTRVNDFVNRGLTFDPLYIYEPLLEACSKVIAEPFKLSTMHARTVRPHAAAQTLHVDFPRDDVGWPMIGFIFMVDEFRRDNGATSFIPGSHRWSTVPEELSRGVTEYERQIFAGGSAGSVIIHNGSIWHGHTQNRTNQPRRSIQGAFIRRRDKSAGNLPERMHPETLARIQPVAKYLLGLDHIL
jgi:ectoine hydroxylase-related dioxygenase (phytanoyl-CoA dioxygenase family)